MQAARPSARSSEGLRWARSARRTRFRVVGRELLTGLLLGLLLGVIGFVFTCVLLGHPPIFGAVIALAILGICIWANGVGALVPLLARRFNIDPALVLGAPDQHAGRRDGPVDFLYDRHRPVNQTRLTRELVCASPR